MKPEDLQQIETLFHRVLECEPGERAALLDQSCAGDEPLRHRIEALIIAHEQAGNFMEAPALDVAAKLLAGDQTESLIGQRIGNHEIVAPLGSGGMGEVYLAHDTSLGRKVALKLLPAYYTKDADRLRRFQREARAASALNHPNILTIYEIGQVDGRHFIATEFIDGVTLRQRMERTPMKMGETLDVALQVAGALAEAHAAGIIHRDIKPENIMVRRDGLVKVLDFGLAKLTELSVPDDTEVPTRALVNTEPGSFMGTVQYMSPEQVRGLETDARTDIWSLGVVLYEMLAGQRPFADETKSDCIASILEHEPLPLAHYYADAPEALQRIMTKALTKEKEDRYQTISEMLADLRRLKQRLEAGSELERLMQGAGDEEALMTDEGRASVADTKLLRIRTNEAQAAQNTAGGEPSTDGSKPHRKGLLIKLTALALIIAGVSFGIYKIFSQPHPPSPSAPFQAMKISRLTSTGKAAGAAISPDGKYVVYSIDDDGRQSLWLRHIPTSSDKEIVAPAGLSYRGLTFSHDGNYIYFIGSREDTTSDGLYQVTVLGGDLRKVSGNAGSNASNITMVNSIALSPDDQRVAFARRPGGVIGSALVVMKTDGTSEQELVKHGMADRFGEPSWSPDGKAIVYSVADIPAGYSFTFNEVNVADGKERQLSSQKWWSVGRLAWLRDGTGFVMTASDQPFGLTQVWFVSYPDVKARRVTNDLNEYYDVSLTADSGALVARQVNQRFNVSIVPNGDANRARPITFGDSSISDLSWTPDNRIFYSSMAGGKPAIWLMDADGKNQKQLAPVARVSIYPSMTRDLRHIVFHAYSGESWNVWRMDADGSNLKQLTDDGGVFPSLTPDDKWVVYFKLTASGGQIRRVPIEGGAPMPITDETVNAVAPMVSPDGKWIACSYSSPKYRAATPAAVFRTAVIPLEGGEPIKVFDNLLGGPENDFGWTADSRALTYIVTRGGVSNIWSQPLDSGQPKQLTDFKSEQINAFDWSLDGKQLLVLRGTSSSDVVMLSDFK
jgi:serine/threonine protein kinase/Tol biopolymer transport system component